MAHYNDGTVLPFVAGSAVGQGVAVHQPWASPANETVLPAPSPGLQAFGITKATQASYGYEVGVVVTGVAKARAAASLGAGALVGPASSNGALGPVLPSGQLASAGPSAGIFLPRYVVGKALKSAAAGDYFPVMIQPQQVV